MAIRTLLLVAALAAGLVDVVAAQHPFDDLPRWDFWPPLVGGARFTGRYLSSEPGGIHLKRQSFEPIDLFQLQVDKPSTNALLYGNVLLDPIFPADLTTDSAVQAAFQAAVKSIKTHANVHVSPEIKLVQATVFPLKVTGDNGESEMSILQDSTGVDGRMYRFTSHVTFGFNFYLTLEDAKFNLRHREEVADEETDEAVKCGLSETNALPLLRDRYTKRLDHLVKFVKEAQADIIGFQEVRYDGVFGEPGNHAQVKHLADRLPGYQYVYQAAMTYINSRMPYERITEVQRADEIEIWEYMRQGKGKTQVLLGDLNSEPQSLAFASSMEKRNSSEAEPRSTDPDDRQHKFTFPSDNPSKRIDFVLYRGEGRSRECEIIGQDPTETRRTS
ncbi:PGAP2-interacting protein [Phytophthora cactorum]|nr:PGAP2-interacting protein [Phytophthora cactorum]